MAKRHIFRELTEGVAAMAEHREGKITLRDYKVEPTSLPKVDAKLIKDTREKLRSSRAVFARKLRINERTLEKWEQGRAKPNARGQHPYCWFVSSPTRSIVLNRSRPRNPRCTCPARVPPGWNKVETA